MKSVRVNFSSFMHLKCSKGKWLAGKFDVIIFLFLVRSFFSFSLGPEKFILLIYALWVHEQMAKNCNAYRSLVISKMRSRDKRRTNGESLDMGPLVFTLVTFLRGKRKKRELENVLVLSIPTKASSKEVNLVFSPVNWCEWKLLSFKSEGCEIIELMISLLKFWIEWWKFLVDRFSLLQSSSSQ